MSKNKGIIGSTLLLFLFGMASADSTPPDVRFRTIIYFYPGVSAPQITEDSEKFGGFKTVSALPEQAQTPLVTFRVISESELSNHYPVPDIQYLSYFGRGMDKSQAHRIQDARQAMIIDVACPRSQSYQCLKSASKSVLGGFDPDDSLIWDSATRELFTAQAWKSARVDAWYGDTPLVAQQTVIHAYKGDNGGVRAITLGMEKFGLPDIVVTNFSWSSNNPMGNLINLVGQSMVEGVVPDRKGRLKISIDSLKPTAYKETLLAGLKDNAERNVELAIGEGQWEEGDPQNFLIEILFDGEEGNALAEKQESLLSRLFGWEDSISYVKHNQMIEDASKRAKRKLNGLRRDFNEGLDPGEFIELKAPFETPDGGTEWMWVEVTSWKGNKITGMLKNEPYNIPDLRGGTTVKVNQKDIFDYLRTFPDGSSEGNETGELIMKYQL